MSTSGWWRRARSPTRTRGRPRSGRSTSAAGGRKERVMNSYEPLDFDVLVIGAGGAGLRAAIEASAMGLKTGLVCKSLLGKAHTVMAEGGVAAALGSVDAEDNWQAHFRDTM